MDSKSPFSDEYDIRNSTESETSMMQGSTAKDGESKSLIEKIESDYLLSKPKRKIIRARIIPK